MLGVIAVVVVVFILGVLLLASRRPVTSRVQRTASIAAPPEKIFPLINDFHSWGLWSPYEKVDPAMTRNYAGAASGPGAVYEWAGNGKVGAGRMEITEASPPRNVHVQLDFLRPFKAHNVGEFVLEPNGDSTNVTWAMDGSSPFVMRVMGVFVDTDKMIGKDFETGLANMKSVAEQ